MEKKVLFTELDDRGSHLRKEITPTAVVTDKRRFPTAQFWDANKTYDVIVADATSASDTLEKAETNLIISVMEDYPKRCKLPIRPVLKLTEQLILGKTVTDAEKATWNAKANASDVYTKAEIDQMLLQLANS